MTVPAQLSPRVEALRKKMQVTRGRLIFALDATASREATWDLASQLQSQMFETAAAIGGLDMQLVYYRGTNEVRHSSWLSDARELVTQMSTIKCMAGATQIARVLRHIRAENEREKVSAAIFIGDAVEEPPNELYSIAMYMGVPLFVFQEGDALAVPPDARIDFDAPLPKVETIFRELARLTGGGYGRFDAGAARQLGELLRAAVAFAVGGVTALANQHTDSARKLLGQMK